MGLKLGKSSLKDHPNIKITGSKSESNRLLLLQALCQNIQIENLSNSDDSQLMQTALLSNEDTIDIHHAGTAMRFLTAYYAIQKGRDVTLTGSKRMTERPIKILVDALRYLGADIEYLKNEGYPPLKIKGKKLQGGKVTLKANVSSQYISALMLIGAKLKNGLELHLEGAITSVPYIKMTLALLNEIGVETSFTEQTIKIKSNYSRLLNRNQESEIKNQQSITVESDWSSASYFYSIVALSNVGAQVTLSSYKKDSLQGDSILVDIYNLFGVETKFSEGNAIILKKTSNPSQPIYLDLKDAPDIAQTIAVTALGLGVSCQLQGLHTLKIKETDRLEALKNEIEKLGGTIHVSKDALQLKPSKKIISNIKIATYNDHRMAMAFAPLALKVPIEIEDANVVSKSYPDFWEDLKTLGVSMSKQ